MFDLLLQSSYKFYVKALNAKGKVICTSTVVHVATKGGNVTNAKSIAIKAKVNENGKAIGSYKALESTVVKAGESVELKVSITPADKKLRLSEHRTVRYVSTNKSVATVTAKDGVVTGMKPGTCYIRAYVHNGVTKRLKVTVEE